MTHIVDAINNWITAEPDQKESNEFGLYVATGGGVDDAYVGRVTDVKMLVPGQVWVLVTHRGGKTHEIIFSEVFQSLFTGGEAKSADDEADTTPILMVRHSGRTLLTTDEDIIRESINDDHIIWELTGAAWEAVPDGEHYNSYVGKTKTHVDNIIGPYVLVPKSMFHVDYSNVSEEGDYFAEGQVNVANLGFDDCRHRHDFVVTNLHDKEQENYVPIVLLFGNPAPGAE